MAQDSPQDDFPDRDIDENLDRSRIAIPLLERMLAAGDEACFDVILDLNLFYQRGRRPDAARGRAEDLIESVVKEIPAKPRDDEPSPGIRAEKSRYAYQHLFACLTKRQLQRLGEALDKESSSPVHKIWPDEEVHGLLSESLKTVKADAAHAAFGADGRNTCWAVIDSGIDGSHPHFIRHDNLSLDLPLRHVDFTADEVDELHHDAAPRDPHGHGTHVAGIIAGELPPDESQRTVVTRERDHGGSTRYRTWDLDQLRGIAPKCRLVSLRVLDETNRGKVSNIIAALGYVDQMNRSAQWPLIHGINLSVGYAFDAEWFACGQSPLCVEVNRLVRSGTPVVTAAGNTGYGKIRLTNGQNFKTGLPLSINDPGNAELAITVGATHRESPHTYGVSYFSSKGPTGDGRLKPDLVAPGERIISCAAGRMAEEADRWTGESGCQYREESGTSMAAPHVSGAIAAFLSIRREFIGQPERLKEILLSTCTDLGRERYFQGRGLLDLMRAIQSV